MSSKSEVARARSLFVSCNRCEQLHEPQNPLDFNPICPDCTGTARHEAGHAVVAVLLYPTRSLDSARIELDEQHECLGVRPLAALGLHASSPPPSAAHWKRRVLTAFGTACYAGIAAEFPEADLEHLETGSFDLHQPIEEPVDDELFGPLWAASEQDRANLATFAGNLGLSCPANRWDGLSWEHARRLLSGHSASVEAIAGALLARGWLAGSRVEALVAGRTAHRV